MQQIQHYAVWRYQKNLQDQLVLIPDPELFSFTPPLQSLLVHHASLKVKASFQWGFPFPVTFHPNLNPKIQNLNPNPEIIG